MPAECLPRCLRINQSPRLENLPKLMQVPGLVFHINHERKRAGSRPSSLCYATSHSRLYEEPFSTRPRGNMGRMVCSST
jgi:hypothetical protein